MEVNKRVWLNKHGELAFSEDQCVCVRVFWESKYNRTYLNTNCNGETMGIDNIYAQVRERLFRICEGITK